ncbi:MAG: glycosyltransferase family 2 protein [bacterium]|nr:glycosyltransferase family 2 protein [bacterium]
MQEVTGLTAEEAAGKLERSLLRLRSSKGYQISKLLLAFRRLPWGAKLRLLSRLVRRLFEPDLNLGLPESAPVLAMEETVGDIRRLAGRPLVYATQPLVSVMVPVYNHADLLQETVASVRAQSYSNWELIILDDGSTDALDELFAALADDPRIRLYRQENQLLPNALTHLHQLARGELLTWVSADNVLAPEMLSELVAAIAEDPGTVMVYGDVALIDADGQPFSGEYRDHNRDPERPEVLRLPRHVGALGEEPDNFINACFLYRAWAAEAIGDFAPDLNRFEDYDYFLRLRRSGRCRHLGNRQPLYFYRIHRRSMTQEVLDALEPQIRRGRQLIALDKRRREWANRRWQVAISENIGAARRDQLRALLTRLAVDPEAPGAPPQEGAGAARRIRFLAPGEEPADGGLWVSCHRDHYLVVRDRGRQRTAVKVPVGERISLLATKARRQCNPSPCNELRSAGGRPCLGVHTALSEVDVEATIAIVRAHPELAFVVIDDEHQPDLSKGEKIRTACENGIYLGPLPFGVPAYIYADLAAVLCPPLVAGSERTLRRSSLLAVATGRWLLYPATCRPAETLPWALPYTAGRPLPALRRRPAAPDVLLDRWLEWGDELRCLERVLELATAAGQDLFVARPDFGQLAPEGEPPRPWIGTP